MNNKTFEYKNILYPINIVKKDQYNSYLRVRNLEIFVTIGNTMKSEKQLDKFIYGNSNFIIEKLEHMINNKKFSLEEKFITINDKKYNFEIIENKKNSLKFFPNKNLIKFYIKKNNDNEKVIWNLLKLEIEKLWTKTISEWSRIMNVEVNEIKISSQRSRWGYWNNLEKKIMLNTKLIFFNFEVVKYLIVHELAHAYHQDHSRLFWNKVKEYMPNYKEFQKQLKNVSL